MVHLALLVRQLACTETGIFVDQHRRLNLLVTSLGVAVEEEVDQGALKLCSLTLVNRETGAGNLHAEVEVNDVIFLGELPMRQGICREGNLRSSHLHHLVVLRALAFLDQTARDVWQQHEVCLKFLSCLLHTCKHRSRLLLESGHLSLGGFSILLEALLHQDTNLGSELLLL